MINQSQARLKSWISGGVALGAMILWIAGLYIAGAEETSRAAPKPEKIVAAKVSRVRADLRAMATAVESYFVDHNQYPATTLDQAKGIDAAIMAKYPSGNWKVPTHLRGLKTNPPQAGDLFTLTTPISYITKYF
ncbi:hypothetical protein HY256_07195, partial [Candidatus Sumerlaeota bacterium]|nr:hypothetical protein [Candidatus Sumerlaeota bacterium]